MDAYQTLSQWLNESERIVFFTGAGMSTESGIPDFRSADGIFMQETGTHYTPEQVISHSFFIKYPAIYFDFHFTYLVYPEAKPNEGHRFIAELERKGKQVQVVTQNIDGLHQLAGSSTVYELHGSVWDNYCLECGQHYAYQDLHRDANGIPRCPNDGGIVRPNIVMYEEGLDQSVVQPAIRAIQQADCLVILGTSLVVYPAAGFVDYYQGNRLAVINKTPMQTHRLNALIFQATISQVFSRLQVN